ncbi:MAG: flagellar hook-associated protein FlgK [Pirellulales bacterium]
MSLFGSIQMGGNTLQAMQIGLQVVGNNIANASTPGYIRQEAVYLPAGVQNNGKLILGLGVQVDSIVQKLDKFVQARLIGAKADRANSEVQEGVYKDLETLLNELSDKTDLSGAFTDFFKSVDEVLKVPNDAGTRNLAVGKGMSLTENINNLYSRALDIKTQLDDRVTAMSDEINNLAETIRQLNVQIASSEVGDGGSSEAGGLRVQRQLAVDRLSEIVNIHVEEQPNGGLSIGVGGELLVFEGSRQEVDVDRVSGEGASTGYIEFSRSHGKLEANSGELGGLYIARDQIVTNFIGDIDNLASTLAFEFNKLYSQGQGLTGFQNLTTNNVVNDLNAPLDAAGLPFTPNNGYFKISVRSREAPEDANTTTINVDLNGFGEDTSLNDLASQLDAIDGITASVTQVGQLQIKADSPDIDFSFSEDNSGVLAALGLNTFFTGSTAATLGVNDELKGISNAGKFAASLDGIGQGSGNAERLSSFFDRPLDVVGGASIADMYDQTINSITQGSSVSKSVAEGYRTFEDTLEGQKQAVSGVSIDEEAVKMLTFQRIFQATAKYIQTISDMLDMLVKI